MFVSPPLPPSIRPFRSSVKGLSLPPPPVAPEPTATSANPTTSSAAPPRKLNASAGPPPVVKPPSGQGALPTVILLPPPSPPLSPSSPNLAALAALPSPSTLPLGLPPHPTARPDAGSSTNTSASGSSFFPPSPPPDAAHALQHQALPLPLISPFAKALYPLPPLPADVARRNVAAGLTPSGGGPSTTSGRSQSSSRGAGSVSSRKSGSNKQAANSAGTGAGQEGIDLTRWYAQVNANPVWKLVGGARKCLGSDDWAVRCSLVPFLLSAEPVADCPCSARLRSSDRASGAPFPSRHGPDRAAQAGRSLVVPPA